MGGSQRDSITQAKVAHHAAKFILHSRPVFLFFANNVMNAATQTLSTTEPVVRSTKPIQERYFYSIATVLLLVLTVVGFQLFYFRGQMYPGRPLTPPIKTLVITHGVAMSLWMLLAILQPLLVASNNRKVHMTLGKIAAVIAACLVVLGFKLGIASNKVAPPDMMFGSLTPKQFLSVPILAITLFAIFVAIGVWFRKRPDIHRPMMFMASLTAVGAAISRIDTLNHLYGGTVWEKLFGFFFFTAVAGALFLIAKCVVFRKFDRWFATAFAGMVVWFWMATQGAKTQAWDAAAGFLLR
jgi:hypothetical protein